jgi:hypothetical protein
MRDVEMGTRRRTSSLRTLHYETHTLKMLGAVMRTFLPRWTE